VPTTLLLLSTCTHRSSAGPCFTNTIVTLALLLQALETSILALKELVAAIGTPLIAGGHMTQLLLDCTCRGAAHHVNRHVREASFQLIVCITQACGTLCGSDAPPAGPSMAAQFVPVLARGLQVSIALLLVHIRVYKCV
jgi:hypothetical protein